MPDCSVLRLNADGLPDVLMDMYFGTDGPESNAALRQLAESFQFGSEDSDGADAKSLGYRDSESGERADLPDWRTLISPGVTMPEGEPNMTFFDPSKDIVIAFRPARMNLSCSLSWRVGFDGYHHSGVTTWFGGVMLADGITAVAQARRDRNTNPNLYLYRWNGSSWPLVRRSEKGSYMDMVNWNSASCTRSAFQLGVHMANEGYYSAYIFTFDAG
ncbi:MAG: hypothetical protein HOP15_17945 [Planctomycetes bacterium]|nr:hypothetical protein [Planctomycetota bacterium]